MPCKAGARRLHGGNQSPRAAVRGIGFRCARSASDTTPVRAVVTEAKPTAPATNDELVANACKICKKHDNTFCDMDFPFSNVPTCDAYDELRNCIFARFGYVFAKPKWAPTSRLNGWETTSRAPNGLKAI